MDTIHSLHSLIASQTEVYDWLSKFGAALIAIFTLICLVAGVKPTAKDGRALIIKSFPVVLYLLFQVAFGISMYVVGPAEWVTMGFLGASTVAYVAYFLMTKTPLTRFETFNVAFIVSMTVGLIGLTALERSVRASIESIGNLEGKIIDFQGRQTDAIGKLTGIVDKLTDKVAGKASQ